MSKLFLLLSSLSIIVISSFGQISGRVKDKQTGKPLSNAEVFINNTSISSITGASGEFSLDGIAPGFAELVVYRNGYSIFKSSLRIQIDKAYKLNLDLTAEENKPKAKARPDAEYKKNLQWFERALLGGNSNASLCTITNSKVISFSREGANLHVSCSEPLVINNDALGYQIKCYVPDFDAVSLDERITSLYKFDSLQVRKDGAAGQWERNRLKSYWGSERHFFHSLVKGTAAQEGFRLFTDSGKQMPHDTLVAAGRIKDYYLIKLNRKTKVQYTYEKGATGIQQMDTGGQVSWIEISEPLEVTIDGIPFNARALQITGIMSENRLADQLPFNYAPTASLNDEQMDWKNFSLLREKVYLHTDRDYYYPRETIWLKAYLGYSMPTLRDTLSKTLYVELISPAKTILDTKVYPIQNGSAMGDFQLDKSLPAGQYVIRAYTNWMRNYGDSTFFIRTIPVLNLDQNVEVLPMNFQNNADHHLTISLARESFKARERVDVAALVLDENKNPVRANLSVTITDVIASVPLSSMPITHPQSLKVNTFETPDKYFDQITYFMERGISFSGVVKDSKNNPTPASLQIIQGNMDNLITMETDEAGVFLVTGLKFTDSLMFAFKPVNRKGKPLDRVELLPRKIPSLDFTYPSISLKLKKEDALQRIQNTYQAQENVRLLEEVEVKSTRLASGSEKRDVKVYGTPDYVVKGDKITGTSAGTNFLVGLQGKVPGLQVTESMDGGGFRVVRVRIRGGTSSLTGDTEPLILVDGVPFPDAQSISAVDPSQVDRVEVITRASPQFGSRGTNGIIAIYTKSGRISPLAVENDYLAYKIPGYSKYQKFYSPDYSGPSTDSQGADFRTTIFWKPDLKTDEKGNASFGFYTADLATRYRIVVEGVTEKGTPVRAESFITVE